MSNSESRKAKSGEPEHPNRLTQKPSEKSPSTVTLPEKANVPVKPTSLMPFDDFTSNEEAAFEHLKHPKLSSSSEEEKNSEDDVIILESPTNTSLYIALEETSNVLVDESSLFWDDLNCTPQSSDYNCNLDAAGPSTSGHTGSQDLPNYSCPSSSQQTKAPSSERTNPEVDQDVQILELTPPLYIDFEEMRKNEEEWRVFVKNGNYFRQEYLSYVNQSYTLCEMRPMLDRIELIFSNLRELELERDALKEKVLSGHHLSIERTYLINLHTKQLLLERKDLKDKVLKVHQQRLALRKSFMSRNSAPGPSQSTVEESARKLDEPRERVQGVTEVVYADPVSDISVKTNRKRKPSYEANQKKTKSKNTVDIPPVGKPAQVPTKVIADAQAVLSNNTQVVPQNQIDEISLTICSTISQSVDSQAASKFPSGISESTQENDTASANPPVSTQRAISPAPAQQTISANTDASENLPHLMVVRCVNSCGPYLFTASEDGTVSIYQLNPLSLVKKIRVSTLPVTLLYGLSLSRPTEVLNSMLKSITEYRDHSTVITGGEDGRIRQYALNTGSFICDKFCNFAVTCADPEGTSARDLLYIGTEEGVIFTYNPQYNCMRLTKIKVNGVICMKLEFIRGKRAIMVAARQMHLVIFDLETEDTLFTMDSNTPSSSFYCISSFSPKYVFCCDANNNLLKFDADSGNLLQTETLSASAVRSFHDGKRFLILACVDGVVRVVDTLNDDTPSPVITLQRRGSDPLTCMKVFSDQIFCGTLSGNLLSCRLPDLEALHKATPSK